MKQKVNVIIPLEDFREICTKSRESQKCDAFSCVFSRARCQTSEMCEGIRNWWNRTNGLAPGFEAYELVFVQANQERGKLYLGVLRNEACSTVYAILKEAVREAFQRH